LSAQSEHPQSDIRRFHQTHPKRTCTSPTSLKRPSDSPHTLIAAGPRTICSELEGFGRRSVYLSGRGHMRPVSQSCLLRVPTSTYLLRQQTTSYRLSFQDQALTFSQPLWKKLQQYKARILCTRRSKDSALTTQKKFVQDSFQSAR